MRFTLFIFAVIVLILSQSAAAQTQDDEEPESLILQTRVLKITAKQTERESIDFAVEVENTFTNIGEEPLIILQPYDEKDDEPLLFVGIKIKAKHETLDLEYPVYFISPLPSVCDGCEREFDKKLNKQKPPPTLTRILRKNESWIWKTTIRFGMRAKRNNYFEGNWEEISQIKTKTRAAITYSMFPNNSRIGEKIKKRWAPFGVLFLSEIHSLITSEPFEIDFKNLEIQK